MAGDAAKPEWLTTGWILSLFGQQKSLQLQLIKQSHTANWKSKSTINAPNNDWGYSSQEQEFLILDLTPFCLDLALKTVLDALPPGINV